MENQDEKYMAMALELACKGRGRVSPNPMVGAVVVKHGKVIGRGYHRKAGEPHAEVYALMEAGEKARGAAMYVTLEPCCHEGRTPPCTKKIISAGISHVIAATGDPNPKVRGKGLEELRQAGIEVSTGVLEAEARRLNEVFFKYIATGLPFVILKAAASLDGKIATRSGDSRWITGRESRTYGHYLRGIVDAVLVGINTICADDPLLNVRLAPGFKDPVRIVLDSGARIPLTARVIREDPERTVVAATEYAPKENTRRLLEQGIHIWQLPAQNGRVSLAHLLRRMGEEKLTSLLVEGGGEAHAGFLELDLADKIALFIAPKIIGGRDAPSWVGGRGAEKMEQCGTWSTEETRMLGEDMLWILKKPLTWEEDEECLPVLSGRLALSKK
ncbi:MAG: bifunctional diaminohydroxyphosphoribosylaminopyrimidine deaminase/5-amino-6-(5-phosphoribosylamino)uracil reductase RibD [Bacillota bacterium]